MKKVECRSILGNTVVLYCSDEALKQFMMPDGEPAKRGDCWNSNCGPLTIYGTMDNRLYAKWEDPVEVVDSLNGSEEPFSEAVRKYNLTLVSKNIKVDCSDEALKQFMMPDGEPAKRGDCWNSSCGPLTIYGAMDNRLYAKWEKDAEILTPLNGKDEPFFLAVLRYKFYPLV